MKSLTAALLVLISIVAHAQAPLIADHGKIYGVVIDSTNNAGVEFANVALLDPATKRPINGNVCDDKGKFEIAQIPVGNYIVSISFIGYNTKLMKVQLTAKNKDINLGNVTLSPSVT